MIAMRLSALPFVLALLPASSAIPQSTGPTEPRDGFMLLVQSELEHLEVAAHRISIDFRDEAPASVLDRLARKAKLSIEIQRGLPEARRLTATFRHATVREILEWFAREVEVDYRAERPDKLLVLMTEAR